MKPAMRKNYLLMPALMMAFGPAFAAFEIEREPAPTYYPHAAVSPVAAPAPAQPYTAAPQPAAPLQMAPAKEDIQPHSAQQNAGAAAPQQAPAEVKRLISEDAKRAMNTTQRDSGANTASTSMTKSDPRLGKLEGVQMDSLSSNFSLRDEQVTEQAQAAVQVKEVATTEVAPVEVTPVKRETPWAVESGSFMRDTLTKWAAKAGWSIVWNMPENEDFRIDSANAYGGDFSEAVRSLFDSLPPHIQIFATQVPDNMPPLLYVTREPGAR